MSITSQLPAVAAAIRCMVADQGSTIVDVEINQLALPAEIANEVFDGSVNWQAVNGFLALLSPAELETLCCGAQEDQAAILRTRGPKQLRDQVHGALEHLFMQIGG